MSTGTITWTLTVSSPPPALYTGILIHHDAMPNDSLYRPITPEQVAALNGPMPRTLRTLAEILEGPIPKANT